MRENFQGGITQVPGVRVGHVTYSEGEIQTGITAILPHGGNLFREKVVAAAHVVNGFGKSTGLIQINELGTLESPILLTNTLSVGRVSDGLVDYILGENPEIGVTTGTVNPVVLECNDGRLNEIRRRFFTAEDVAEAIAGAREEFQEGAVGAGRGMVCYGLKGGIGSASRQVVTELGTYTLGALVLSNFGQTEQLTIHGEAVGRELAPHVGRAHQREQGSIIVVLATDLPLSHRQLQRLARRAQSGIARTGGITAHGSGEVVLAFSTAQKIPHEGAAELSFHSFSEQTADGCFAAVIEGVEEAILRSLYWAETVTGVRGNKFLSLREALKGAKEEL
ncbi:MAG: P1 family peptidase [Tissierellia bacterium]|nr:P1 family peptidase [Tissierellia bacterium]